MPATMRQDPLGIWCVFSDGTTAEFSLAGLPCPDLASDLLAGLAELIHPHGSVDAAGSVNHFVWPSGNWSGLWPGGDSPAGPPICGVLSWRSTGWAPQARGRRAPGGCSRHSTRLRANSMTKSPSSRPAGTTTRCATTGRCRLTGRASGAGLPSPAPRSPMMPTPPINIESPGAWLTMVASRICLDLLGSARVRLHRYLAT